MKGPFGGSEYISVIKDAADGLIVEAFVLSSTREDKPGWDFMVLHYNNTILKYVEDAMQVICSDRKNSCITAWKRCGPFLSLA
jgi:hypothetical protein